MPTPPSFSHDAGVHLAEGYAHLLAAWTQERSVQCHSLSLASFSFRMAERNARFAATCGDDVFGLAPYV